jgi:hypothetical protein
MLKLPCFKSIGFTVMKFIAAHVYYNFLAFKQLNLLKLFRVYADLLIFQVSNTPFARCCRIPAYKLAWPTPRPRRKSGCSNRFTKCCRWTLLHNCLFLKIFLHWCDCPSFSSQKLLSRKNTLAKFVGHFMIMRLLTVILFSKYLVINR